MVGHLTQEPVAMGSNPALEETKMAKRRKRKISKSFGCSLGCLTTVDAAT